jgi:L-threonylcarbamoyladenylate synthase
MTELLPGDAAGVFRAAELLRAGELVGFATETVYGLGADAANDRSVAAVFEAKGRPRFNPLICHYADAEAAFAHVATTPLAERLAAAFWPGPLTLVLPRRPDCPVSLLAGAGLETLAVRVPAHPLARDLLRAVSGPLAAPSANRSGEVSPTSAAHVLAGLDGRIAAVLEGGACLVGVESSVLDLTGGNPVLLRPGGATREAIEARIGPVALSGGAPGTPRSPGQLLTHYAPRLPLRINAATVAPDEALLAFGPKLPGAGVVFQLSETADLTEAAARLFAGLRALDAEGARLGLRGIAAMKVPEVGLGVAIGDRLGRASAASARPGLDPGLQATPHRVADPPQGVGPAGC